MMSRPGAALGEGTESRRQKATPWQVQETTPGSPRNTGGRERKGDSGPSTGTRGGLESSHGDALGKRDTGVEGLSPNSTGKLLSPLQT